MSKISPKLHEEHVSCCPSSMFMYNRSENIVDIYIAQSMACILSNQWNVLFIIYAVHWIRLGDKYRHLLSWSNIFFIFIFTDFRRIEYIILYSL